VKKQLEARELFGHVILTTSDGRVGTPPLLDIPASATPQAVQAIHIQNFNISRDWEETLSRQMQRTHFVFHPSSHAHNHTFWFLQPTMQEIGKFHTTRSD